MTKELVITTKEWGALVECLKGNLKFGYSKLKSLKHDGVYYTAILCQDIDSSYVERLKIVTGDEEIGVKGLIDFLNHSFVPSDFVVKEEVVQESPPVQTESVIKIKRVSRSKK